MMFLKLTRWARSVNGTALMFHSDPVWVNRLTASGVWALDEGVMRRTYIPTVGENQNAAYAVCETPEEIMTMLQELM